MKTIKLSMAAAAALILGLSSCKKDEVTPTTPVKKTTTTSTTTSGYGAISIKLAHKFGMMNEQTFALGKQVIHPMKQDTMIFSKFKYFISNIRFKRTDGTYYVENESYRLIDLATPSSLTLALNKIPAGKYIQMEYTMGVDAARNMDGAQTGALAITNDMFWSWNSGYKFLVVNGTSTSLTGFNGVHLSIGADKSCSFNFRSLILAPSLPKIKVEKDKVTQIKFTYNLMAMLRNTDGTNYSFISTNPNISYSQVHGGSTANIIRGNIQQALELNSFTNPQ